MTIHKIRNEAASEPQEPVLEWWLEKSGASVSLYASAGKVYQCVLTIRPDGDIIRFPLGLAVPDDFGVALGPDRRIKDSTP